MIKGLISLAFGALSFGIIEFVAMGLLPYFAADFGVSIAMAGQTISFYAFGVVAGALGIIFCQRFNLKRLMLVIVALQLVGILLTPMAQSFEMLLAGRFVSGLPHGCFFGVGAIIAQRIAVKGKSNAAMAIMIAGQTVSNVFGVPLGTFLAHAISWQTIFYIMAVWDVVVLLSMLRFLPDTGHLEEQSFLGQFRFLRHRAAWLVFGTIFLDSVGIFCVHTYVSPMLTGHVGLALEHVPAVLIVIGMAMMIFNLLSGRLADLFTSGKVTFYFLILALISMLLLGLAGGHVMAVGIVTACIVPAVLFGVGTPEQVAIVRCARGGELLGVALGQVCFNMGNAVGALLGALPMEHGYSVASITYIGALPLALAIGLIFVYVRCDEAVVEAARDAERALEKEA